MTMGPIWSRDWALFATWRDGAFAFVGLLLIVLMILWWRQQSPGWLRVSLTALLAALLLSIASYYTFVVPPHVAGCPQGCPGWRGYPLRFALFREDGRSLIGAADFALNVLVLWLVWLAATYVWRLLGAGFHLETRGRRWTWLFVFLFVLAPWALLPRIITPPQPQVSGEDLRYANNAIRAAEFTYGVTGVWVHRLALEDMLLDTAATAGSPTSRPADNLVCLRGYTYFFVPWRRYVIGLDAAGATALSLDEVPLGGSCWQALPAASETAQ
jgi:hypothetical protein